jgi:hypothetical protein
MVATDHAAPAQFRPRRGAGRCHCRYGQGGTLAVLRLQEQPEWDADDVCKEIAALDCIVAARILVTDVEQSSIKTREKSMRSGDASFAALLLIEGLDENAVRTRCGGCGRWHYRSMRPLSKISRRCMEPFSACNVRPRDGRHGSRSRADNPSMAYRGRR